VPFFEEHGVPIKTMLSDNGREFCGRPDRHLYELFLQLEGIEHRKTKVRRPQSNGIACPERSRRVARFHRTLLDEHFRVEGRRTWFETVEQMQEALDAHLVTYNTARPHQGRSMNGRPLAGPSSTASPQTTPIGGQRPKHRPD
jgi:transposase InsO family protein